jgi:hypothetical protein
MLDSESLKMRRKQYEHDVRKEGYALILGAILFGLVVAVALAAIAGGIWLVIRIIHPEALPTLHRLVGSYRRVKWFG